MPFTKLLSIVFLLSVESIELFCILYTHKSLCAFNKEQLVFVAETIFVSRFGQFSQILLRDLVQLIAAFPAKAQVPQRARIMG